MLQMKFCGDLVLREICTPVETIAPELVQTIEEMVRMMRDQNGCGLAAPQVGALQRFLVMMNPDDETIFRMINPRITARSSKLANIEEGCLSVLGPDNLPVFAYVTRPAAVTVEWTDIDGTARQAEMSGLAARIVQHETDHLDGKLFIDYLSPIKREMVMRKVRKHKA